MNAVQSLIVATFLATSASAFAQTPAKADASSPAPKTDASAPASKASAPAAEKPAEKK